MWEFHKHALWILQRGLVVDCFDRTMGYPMFLALIYKLFGAGRLPEIYGASRLYAVFPVQAFLDSVTGVLLYLTANHIWGKKTAIFSFGIYMLNPLTSSYTGLLLSETLAIFFVMLATYIITLPSFGKRPLFWGIFGVVLGLLIFTKMVYFYFAILFIGAVGLFSIVKGNRLKFAVITYSMLILVSSYTIIGNLSRCRVFSIVPPFNKGLAEVYLTFYRDRLPELHDNYKLNATYGAIMNEFYTLPIAEINAYREKYSNLLRDRIRGEWPLFITNYLKNIFYIWDKEHLFVYHDPWYPKDLWILRLTNIICLVFFLLGMISFLKKGGRKVIKMPIVFITAGLFVYITILFPLLTNESRQSLPFYPLLFLWAGYGISEVQIFIFKIKSNKL